MRWFQLQMHKKRRNNNNRNHFYSAQFQRTFNQMKRGVTERGEGGGTRRLHWANKGKRNNPTHNSSVTKWHQSIFILLLLFCCVFYCCSASSCCSRKNSKIFAESSGNAKVAHRVSWKLFFTCRGMPPARAICILGTQNTKTTKSWQHLTYNFPADRTTYYLTPFPLRPPRPLHL